MPNEFKVKNGLLVSGSANVNASGSGVFTVDGTSGRLFQVDDSLSGSLFSVNTAAGLPVIEAFSDNTVRIGQFGQRAFFVSQSRVGIGKETRLNATLDVSGSLIVTGSLTVTSNVNAASFTGSLLGTATTASFVTSSNVRGPFGTNSILSASYAVSTSFAATASFALNAGGSSNITIGDEGTTQGTSTYLNFIGAGVTATVASNTASITIPGGGSGGDITIGDEGTTQGIATYLNFTGAGVTATVASNTASITISGGGGGSAKAGSGSAASFGGTPRTASITFGSAFSDNLYTVAITGEDARSFTIQSKSTTGFTINSNSSVALTGPVYWVATTFN